MDTTNLTSASGAAIPESPEANKKNTRSAATLASGAVAGASVPFVIGKIKGTFAENHSEGATEEEAPVAEWADNEISVATGINDEMSFSEAFATARSEVGAGGAFEWRGNVYGTYYAEEWNSMTPADKAEYNNHFSWNKIESPTVSDSTAHNSSTSAQDDIEVVSVDHHSNSSVVAHDGNTVEVVAVEPEIEILGVVHDMSTGTNLGGMTVDGQDVFLIDVDGDMEFDVMASDLNHNNIMEDNEIVDIHGQGMTVNELGGISDITESLNGDDQLPDYMADNTYEI